MNHPVWNCLRFATVCAAVLLAIVYPISAQNIEPDDGRFLLTTNQVIEIKELLQRTYWEVGNIDGNVNTKMVSAAKSLSSLLERELVRRPSGKEIVLNCEIADGVNKGYESIQILIDEFRGIVIYNFHMPGNRDFNPMRKVGENYIDLSMKLNFRNDDIVQANDTNSIFLINKKDGKFVYSFVSPIPLNGSWLVLGNTHQGKCERSAFD